MRPPALLVAGAILFSVVGFAAGWFAGGQMSAPGGPFRVTGHVIGTVSLVDASGGKFCVEPADGSPQRCGVAYRPPGAAALVVGDLVEFFVGEITEGGDASEVFIVASVQHR